MQLRSGRQVPAAALFQGTNTKDTGSTGLVHTPELAAPALLP